jgi:1,4-dihydroxy-2-naphthoate octaprenyltransferase
MTNPTLKTWLLAIRPKTLPASVAPVIIGTAMAIGDGIAHFPTALLCLCASLAIQIGTNLANDYYDFKKGTDTTERIGPIRVTQSGLIKPDIVKLAYIISFCIAGVLSIWLVYRGGWPIAVIGILAVLSGIFYTAGPCPLGYIGLGDLFVFIFFGPVAVGGTYYVQSYEMNMAVVLSGLAPGFLSVAILSINNLRDIASDHKAGKNTLAVRFGRPFAIYECLVSIISASLVPVLIYILIEDHILILTCVFLSLFAIPTMKTVSAKSDGPSLNGALAHTGRLLIVYSILFSIGWIV